MGSIPTLAVSDYALDPSDVERIPTPALIVYLDRVRENLRCMRRLLGGDLDRWRPHLKTSKLQRIFAMLAEVGVRAFKCATPREADHLLRVLDEMGVVGADLLVAYPVAGPGLARVGRLATAHSATRVSVLVDDPAALDAIPPVLGLFIDVDPGMGRTGVPIADETRILALARGAGARLRGLHFYEGHLHGLAPDERQRRAWALFDRLAAVVSRLQDAGIGIDEVVTSGTPTFRDALAAPALADLAGVRHRVSPGTVVLHDVRSEAELPAAGLVPAALVITRVVSRPGADVVTCDAGSKSMAAEAGDPCAAVLGHPGLEAQTPSEEHLPFRVRDGVAPERGAPLLLVPRHVCPTVNLADRALLIEGGRAIGIVPVNARAHDLFLELISDPGPC